MAQYRKKTPTVEAVQFDPHRMPWPAMVKKWPHQTRHYQPRDMSWGYIEMPDHDLHVQNGDWIVTDENGQISLMSSERFERLYEPVQIGQSNGNE